MTILTANQYARNPQYIMALTALASPYILGVIHAQNGQPEMPSEHYSKEGDIAEYTQGYADELAALMQMFVELGQSDSLANLYVPPTWCNANAYDAYVRGWNDQWALMNNHKLSR